MIISNCEQQTPEWWAIKKGKISGTRFGQVISGRKNRLIYELLDEQLSKYLFPDDFVSEDMQFGIDNEPIALKLYEKTTGIHVNRIGAIISEQSWIHMASPDGINDDHTIIQEVKCTQDGSIHIQRFFEGPESQYMPQIKNYFAVSDLIQEVHWMSYCPERPERPLIIIKFKREQFADEIEKSRKQIGNIEAELVNLHTQFIF